MAKPDKKQIISAGDAARSKHRLLGEAQAQRDAILRQEVQRKMKTIREIRANEDRAYNEALDAEKETGAKLSKPSSKALSDQEKHYGKILKGLGL